MRRFDELTREEQVTAIQGTKLQERITEYCTGLYSPAYCNVDEYLHNFPTTGNAYYEIDGAYYGRVELGNDYPAIADYLEELNQDFCLFYDIENAADLIAKIRRYGEVLEADDLGHICIKGKDYTKMENFVLNALYDFEKVILEACKGEYEYFEDIENCIEYCEEMEYFDNIYVTDDLKIIDLDEVKDVLQENNIYWDITTILDLLEKIDNRLAA